MVKVQIYRNPIGEGLYDFYARFQGGLIMACSEEPTLEQALTSGEWSTTRKSVAQIVNMDFLGYYNAPCSPRF